MNTKTTPQVKTRPVRIIVNNDVLDADLTMPERASSIVLFAHGSGSSRLSPRNRFVASQLHEVGFGTLLVDLLTREEEKIDVTTSHFRFDIDLLTERVEAATEWLMTDRLTEGRAIGYFGASTGAAAVFCAAARLPKAVSAIVSRGGRPDLAGPTLSKVQAPTLLIVGSEDKDVLRLNEIALNQLPGERELHIVNGASHLFDETGKLGEVALHSRWWFEAHLAQRV